MMKKKVIMFCFLTVVGLFIHNKLSTPEFMYKEYSPDNQYSIEVYTQKRFFAMPGDGDLRSRMAFVKLKNKWGVTIGESTA